MPESAQDLTGVILAGGLGTRLRSAVGDRQKTVAPVGGRPFLLRILDQLADAGLRDVVLCTGYQAGQVADLIGASYRDMSVRYSPESLPLGTGGALRQALAMLHSDPMLAMNGDSYCEMDLAAFWKSHRDRDAAASLVVTELADTSASGRITFGESREITGFVEKGTTAGPGWINAGIYLLSRAVIESIPSGCVCSMEREVFPAWIGRGLRAFPTTGKFIDIGTPSSYEMAQRLFP